MSQRTTRRDGVTFVHVIVENASSERRRVRLALDCGGATWPPRRRGLPEAGWEEDGVTVTVAAGNVRGLGFATPAPVEGDAVVVTASEPRGGVVNAEQSGDSTPSADGVVRALGEFAPPLAATPREAGTDVDTVRSSGDASEGP